MRCFSFGLAGCCSLLACGSPQPARVTLASPSAPTAPLAPATPTAEPVAREGAPKKVAPKQEKAPAPQVAAEPNAPLDTRPAGVADCAGPETAELLVIVGNEPNAPEPLDVPFGPDAPSTVYLSRSGCAVKRVPGVAVSAAGKVWQLQSKTQTVRTSACAATEDDVRPAGVGSAELVELTTAGGRQVVIAPSRNVGDNEYTETTHFVAAMAETLYFKTRSFPRWKIALTG